MSSAVPFPEIQFSQWDNSELADPTGTRHLVSGHFAYVKPVGTGCVDSLVFPNLTLNIGNNDPFVGSDVVVMNVAVSNFGTLQASGLNALYNMKLWAPAGSGTILDLPSTHLQYQMSGVWTPNFNFPSGAGQQFSPTLPSQFNLRRIDGRAEILGYDDNNVSEWIYMRLFLDAGFPVGTFGACGSGTFRLRLTYDFY